jgi:hypothetical protein
VLGDEADEVCLASSRWAIEQQTMSGREVEERVKRSIEAWVEESVEEMIFESSMSKERVMNGVRGE